MGTSISADPRLYTYRNGRKVYLTKQLDEFVVRAKPEDLAKIGITKDVEKVSSSSSRIKVKKEELDTIMNELRSEVTAHHAYKQEDSNTEFLITDRIIVTFKQPATNDQLNAFMAKYALILRRNYSDKEFLFQLTDQTGMNPIKLVVQINETETDLIESCEHDLNKRMQMNSLNLPADNKYAQQWHLHKKLIDSEFDPRSSSNCEGAWLLLNHFGSSDVVIGVTDDGCKIDHTDFNSQGKFASWGYMNGLDLVYRDAIGANPANMYEQGNDHGTCCAGVIAAEIDGSLAVGAAPGCKLLPVKWESDETGLFISDDKLISVLDFVKDKVDVLSNSWGSSPNDNWSSNVVNKIKSLALTGGRRGKGIVFLWASGNENCPIQFSSNLNIPFTSGVKWKPDGSGVWIGVATSKIFDHSLAGIPGVMHIAALASNAQRSHYSNYGPGISLCAPTNNVHEYHRMAVIGLGITTSSGVSPFFDESFGGTSSATPLIAGIAGLVISANPSLTALQVISILQRTASKDLNMNGYAKTPPANFDTNTSWDISPVSPFNTGTFTNINHPDGTWSPWFGFGKVDAEAAVAEALRLAGTAINNNILVKVSTQSKPIPDNNVIGISDIIQVTEEGSIASIKVEVDITHTYIGDMIIKLISPQGISVVLHNRNGGSTKNITKTYDMQNTPALSAFDSQSIKGQWVLQVADVASIDAGTLNSWKLHIGLSQDQSVMLNDPSGIAIPDNDPLGIERSLVASSDGTLKEIEVGVDITHSYIEDLIVNLVSPGGAMVSLHSRSGGSADNIIKTYNFNNNLNLKTLKGQKVQGTWKLKISDVAGQDIGKLNKWSLKLVKE
jgi:subtilisin-like proprotein convertase family protein/subtilisin family serine protease